MAAAIALTHYDILGVPRSAPNEDIVRAYRKKALTTHPDRAVEGERQAATVAFQQLQNAFEILSDELRRRAYDLTLPRPAGSFASARGQDSYSSAASSLFHSGSFSSSSFQSAASWASASGHPHCRSWFPPGEARPAGPPSPHDPSGRAEMLRDLEEVRKKAERNMGQKRFQGMDCTGAANEGVEQARAMDWLEERRRATAPAATKIKAKGSRRS